MAKILTLTQPDVSPNIYTFIGTDYNAGISTLVLKNTAGLNPNDYLLLSKFGYDQTEIVQVATIDSAQEVTLVAPYGLFPHPSDTTVTQMSYNCFRVYRSLTGLIANGGGPYILLTQLPLQVDELNNYYRDYTAQSPYSYQFTYYNTTNEQESVSTSEIPYTGYPDWALKALQDSVLSLFGGDNAEDFIPRTLITKWVNEFYRWCQFRIQNSESPYDVINTTITSTGDQFYDISSFQMTGIYMVWTSQDGGVTWMPCTPKDFRISDMTGSISLYEYRLVNNQIMFSTPYPTTNMLIQIWYTTIPVNLINATDILNPPFQSNTGVFIDYCLMRAHEKDRKMTELAGYYQTRVNAATNLNDPTSWLSRIRQRIKQGNFAAASTWEDYINGF